MANVLCLRAEAIGLIEGLADGSASLLKIVSGWWSDRIGRRKPVVLAGYGLSTLAKPFLALAQGPVNVLTVRMIDRVGKGVRTSARHALVAESVAPEQRGKAFGFHRGMDTAGAVVGTALALVLLRLYHGDYRRVFLFSTIFGVAAVATILFGVHDLPRRGKAEGKPKKAVAEVAGSLPLFLAAHTVYSAGNFTYAFFLLRAQNVGVAPALVPLFYLWHNVVYAGVALPFGALLDRLGARRAQVLAYLLHGATCVGFGWFARPELLWLWFAVYGLEMGAVGGASRATVSGLIRTDRRGTGMGVFNACEGLGVLVASLLTGYLWDVFGPATTFIWGAAPAVVAAALTLVALRPKNGGGRGEG